MVRLQAEPSVMTPWNAEGLLQPLAGDQPCGDDLEYNPALTTLDAFRVFGQATPPDDRRDPQNREQAPDWSELRSQTLAALDKTRDLRLLAHLAAAVLRTDGLGPFADTLNVAAFWLETYWLYTYPLATDDVMTRRNALNAFADPMAIVEGLRRVPLVRTRHGTVSLRDVDIAFGNGTPGEKDQRLEEAQITRAFAELAEDELARLHREAASGTAALDRIEAAAMAGGGHEAVPDLSRLRAVLVRMERLLRQNVATRRGESIEPGSEGESPSEQPGAVGAIRSRQDAIRALDAVADYFRRNEPSSPIPLIVDRAKRLVAKDFLEVLADIAPDALAQARAAGGISQSE